MIGMLFGEGLAFLREGIHPTLEGAALRSRNTTDLAKLMKDRHPDFFKDLKEVLLHSNFISVQL